MVLPSLSFLDSAFLLIRFLKTEGNALFGFYDLCLRHTTSQVYGVHDNDASREVSQPSGEMCTYGLKSMKKAFQDLMYEWGEVNPVHAYYMFPIQVKVTEIKLEYKFQDKRLGDILQLLKRYERLYFEVDIIKKTKPSKMTTENGMGKTCKIKAKIKNAKSDVNEESAVKPEPELKNTIECNLNPSDGPGKPNSIFMKTVKTKWALNQFQQPICVQLTKTVKTLKTQS
ncbi:hypothetical protein Tco_1349890 [Tanacetum coccineum]